MLGSCSTTEAHFRHFTYFSVVKSYFLCMYMGVQMSQHVWRSEDNLLEFFLFTMLVSGIELWLPVLMVVTAIHWTISPNPGFCCFQLPYVTPVWSVLVWKYPEYRKTKVIKTSFFCEKLNTDCFRTLVNVVIEMYYFPFIWLFLFWDMIYSPGSPGAHCSFCLSLQSSSIRSVSHHVWNFPFI